jgi:hypothetical protein
MAQRKAEPLTKGQKSSLIQKAADHKRLKMLAEEASKNLKLTDRWRKLTEEHKEIVLYRLFGGETISAACRQMGIDVALINQAAYYDEEFGTRLAIARANGQATRIERLDEIPYDNTLSDARAKLLSDNLKWVASRADRKNWGEKLDITGKVESTMEMPDWMFGKIVEAEALPKPDPESEPEDSE